MTAEAQRWQRYAHEDLRVARDMVGGNLGTPRHACLLAQQAAEKVVKAVLIRFQIEFPRTHDLDRLRSLLPSSASAPLEELDLAELSEWAVESRYPGDWPEIGPKDAQRAVEIATAVCDRLTPYVT